MVQKEWKVEMQTSSGYYGDCFKHLMQWNNWNRWDAKGNTRLATNRKLADSDTNQRKQSELETSGN